LRTNDDQVGPGKYNTEEALKKTWRHGPQWSHVGRPHRIVQTDGNHFHAVYIIMT
jgi:hypothetical protein